MTITVVIPAYNAGRYIERAVDSVLAQSVPADEIIVVDDGSTDDTADIVSGYGSKVRYIHQQNAGASIARNRGIQKACFEWIAFLDSDDEWLPKHLEMHLGLLERNPHLVWCTGNFYRCNCQKNVKIHDIDPTKAENILAGREYCNNYFHAYLNHITGCTDTMVIRRKQLEQAGLFRIDQPRLNDMDMWLRIAYRWPKIGYVCEPTAIYHLSISGSIVKAQTHIDIICDYLDRNLNMAAEFNHLNDYLPCAAATLGSWMKNLLTEGRGKEIRQLLKRYKHLHSNYFIFTTYTSSLFPRTAIGYENIKSKFWKLWKTR
jgi:glycosyltransferase involved in cell wall biosynthesis